MELRREREMSEELKACPFCGGKGGNIYDTEKHDPSCYFIKTASMKVMYGTVEEWNTRPIEDALRYKLTVAKDGLENIKHGGYCGFLTPMECAQIAHNTLAEIERIGDGGRDKPDNGA